MGIPYVAANASQYAISVTPPNRDNANSVLAGTFSASGTGPACVLWGSFNVVFGGTGGSNTAWTGSVRLERSFDGGTTWWVCNIGGGGQQAIWTTGTDVNFVVGEPEQGVLYRLNCTALNSGTITYRISTTGIAPTALGIPPN